MTVRFALKKISIANFKFVLMVSYMNCFQLSDGFLFAALRLSSFISPPVCLSFASPPASTAFWREGSACSACNLFLFISQLCPVPWGNERERGGHKLFFSFMQLMQKTEANGWQLQLAGLQLTKQAASHKTHTRAPAVWVQQVKVSLLWAVV